jgi:capsular exopolysaccharide synthesis family protein
MKKGIENTQEYGIVVDKKEYSSRLEEHNRLRDNILFLNADENKKIIQVESAVMSEGKTTVISNLAVNLGLSDKKVVVVDLDFRKPHLHHVFGVEMGRGIAEFMLSKTDTVKVVKHTKYKNVDIVTRGKRISNPAVVFISDKFKNFLERLKAEYDYVLLDCAPVLQISDYLNVTPLSDGVIFVVSYASTTRNQVQEAIKELQKAGANILGTVFNKYESRKSIGYGKYYGKYYTDKIYGEKEEQK